MLVVVAVQRHRAIRRLPEASSGAGSSAGRAIRRLWQQDARELISRDERSAYYTAQRLAARARAEGDRASLVHWVKVAAEVARASPVAEMDLSVVELDRC